ncbi:MAG TPA: hypothetical protein ENF30_02795 [Candidatus Desulfofervidus auxilii]|uniref:Rubrerythrin diiron-binding domain-containing protein n=1 Tax=Desulfofervidus auxilii TaxID=1621989 RepID=A0A7V0IAJ3_DESA2|nr:hypothetical protein [Candidatus Desulfofervidus auxilii]
MIESTEAILSKIEEGLEELRSYYLKAKEKVFHPLCQKLFEILAKEKEKHLERTREIKASMRRGKSWVVDRWIWDVGEGIPNPLKNLSDLSHLPLCTAEDLKRLDDAMEKEEKFFYFMDELTKEASQSLTKRFYLSLAYEGRGYYLLLLETKDCVAHPDFWQQRIETVFMDGA